MKRSQLSCYGAVRKEQSWSKRREKASKQGNLSTCSIINETQRYHFVTCQKEYREDYKSYAWRDSEWAFYYDSDSSKETRDLAMVCGRKCFCCSPGTCRYAFLSSRTFLVVCRRQCLPAVKSEELWKISVLDDSRFYLYLSSTFPCQDRGTRILRTPVQSWSQVSVQRSSCPCIY